MQGVKPPKLVSKVIKKTRWNRIICSKNHPIVRSINLKQINPIFGWSNQSSPTFSQDSEMMKIASLIGKMVGKPLGWGPLNTQPPKKHRVFIGYYLAKWNNISPTKISLKKPESHFPSKKLPFVRCQLSKGKIGGKYLHLTKKKSYTAL